MNTPDKNEREQCEALQADFFANRSLIIAANRGPVMFQTAEDGSRTFTRGSGGLVTALVGLAQQIDATWIGCAAHGNGYGMGTGRCRFVEKPRYDARPLSFARARRL